MFNLERDHCGTDRQIKGQLRLPSLHVSGDCQSHCCEGRQHGLPKNCRQNRHGPSTSMISMECFRNSVLVVLVLVGLLGGSGFPCHPAAGRQSLHNERSQGLPVKSNELRSSSSLTAKDAPAQILSYCIISLQKIKHPFGCQFGDVLAEGQCMVLHGWTIEPPPTV